jgi:Uma2 family endonuclease
VLRYQEDFYLKKQATAQDTHLVIEVAIKTLLTDRSIKLKKYATAGIPEYWIIIPEKQLIEVYRNPEDEVYLEKHSYTKEEEWYFNAFDLLVKGSDLLIIS